MRGGASLIDWPFNNEATAHPVTYLIAFVLRILAMLEVKSRNMNKM